MITFAPKEEFAVRVFSIEDRVTTRFNKNLAPTRSALKGSQKVMLGRALARQSSGAKREFEAARANACRIISLDELARMRNHAARLCREAQVQQDKLERVRTLGGVRQVGVNPVSGAIVRVAGLAVWR